mgnify:CR=1 FL=1
MPNDTRHMRNEPAAVLLSWGSPQADMGEGPAGGAANLSTLDTLLLQALVAILAAGSSYVWAMGLTAPPVARQPGAPAARFSMKP